MIKYAFENKETKNPPIWLMRQAGRYLPEYKKVRSTTKKFFELCYNPTKVAEVTLQPIRRFNLDAAIIFSDILVLPECLGINIEFKENFGPIIKQITEQNPIPEREKLDNKINKVYKAIKLVRSKLSKEKSIIGFCGGPWTVLTYLIEGKSKTTLELSKLNAFNNHKFVNKSIKTLTKHTIEHLSQQILAGADIIQIFDSWAGILPQREFHKYVITPTATIVKALKEKFPEVKIIGFPRNSGKLYHEYVKETKVDGVSCDYNLPLEEMLKLQKKVLVQGNLDPVILLCNPEIIKSKVNRIMSTLTKGRFIFNLGHGILPTTPVANIELLIKLVKNYHHPNE